jgi:multisubunit Na+/H+ antiporter MnhF subunit
MSGTKFLILLGERSYRTVSCYVQPPLQKIVLFTVIIAQYRVIYNHRTISRYVYLSTYNIVLFTIIVAHVLVSHHRTMTYYL